MCRLGNHETRRHKNAHWNGNTFVSKRLWEQTIAGFNYEGWNFNSGNYLFTTDTK